MTSGTCLPRARKTTCLAPPRLDSPERREAPRYRCRLNCLCSTISLARKLPAWITSGLNVNFYFGGTSLLIVVGVAMDTVNQIESQLIMRHYEGFTPRSGRIRGRRATW